MFKFKQTACLVFVLALSNFAVSQEKSSENNVKLTDAQTLIKNQEYEKALVILTEIVSADPQNYSACALRCQVLVKLDWLEAAKFDYAYVKTKDPRNTYLEQMKKQKWEIDNENYNPHLSLDHGFSCQEIKRDNPHLSFPWDKPKMILQISKAELPLISNNWEGRYVAVRYKNTIFRTTNIRYECGGFAEPRPTINAVFLLFQDSPAKKFNIVEDSRTDVEITGRPYNLPRFISTWKWDKKTWVLDKRPLRALSADDYDAAKEQMKSRALAVSAGNFKSQIEQIKKNVMEILPAAGGADAKSVLVVYAVYTDDEIAAQRAKAEQESSSLTHGKKEDDGSWARAVAEAQKTPLGIAELYVSTQIPGMRSAQYSQRYVWKLPQSTQDGTGVPESHMGTYTLFYHFEYITIGELVRVHDGYVEVAYNGAHTYKVTKIEADGRILLVNFP